MKKLIAILLTMILVLSFGAAAFADGETTAGDGSVTVNNAVPGEKYNIYKVFDLTYSGDGQTPTAGQTTDTAPYEGVAYTYTKTGDGDSLFAALNGDGSPFALTESTVANVYNVALKEGKTAADISSFLKDHQSLLKPAGDKQTAPAAAEGSETSTIKWENLSYGYYYITSSLGATVTIDSTLKDVVVEDKNTKPTEDKKQSAVQDGPFTDNEINVSIGDQVYYEVIVTAGKGTNQAITLTDTMSTGLTNNKDYVLYKGTVAEANKLTLNTDYTIDSEGEQGFTITVKAEYVSGLNENEVIILRYSATLNENAITKSEEGVNKNTMVMGYSNQTQTDEVEVTTMKLQIVKDNAQKDILTGAKFKLYDAVTAGNEIAVVKVKDGEYRVAKAGETGVEIEAGQPVIRGLKAGTYYLEETESPAGYNKLTERVAITVGATDNLATTSNGKYGSGGVEVINQSGNELPSTGGIGTTIFYVLGGLMVTGAVVVLVSKKRMEQ